MRTPTDMARLAPRVTMLLMAAAVANAVFWRGGLDRAAWDLSLVLIGLAAVVAGLTSGFGIPAAPLGVLRWTLFLLPAYAIFQALPLPFHSTPLSVKPAATWEHAPRLTCYAFTFLLVRAAVLRSHASVWVPAVPLILVGGLEAIWSLTQAGGTTLIDVPHGTYENRNHLAGLLEMVFPFAVMYAVLCLARSSGKGFPVQGALKFCSSAALALILVIAQLRTLSRMGLISLLAAAVTIVFFMRPSQLPQGWRRWATLAAMFLLSVGALIWLLPPLLVERLSNLSANDFSMDERVRIWRESLPLIRDFPVFGCGLGGYASAFVRYKDPNLSFADFAHNDYLQYLIELGPLVWSLALISTALILVSVVRYAAGTHKREKRFLAIAAAASLLAMLVHSLADYNLYIPANALVFAWVNGIAAGLTGRNADYSAEQN